MDSLKRAIAPILDEAWTLIDGEARRVLGVHLCGRKLVDFVGPLGWKLAAVNTGRLDLLLAEPVPGVRAGLRHVQPLMELRTPIHLDTMELDSVLRGAAHLDLSTVGEAARRMARAEDQAIFNGYAPAQIVGIIGASTHAPIEVTEVAAVPHCVVLALDCLRAAGVGGPYVLVLGTALYEELTSATEEGYPVAKRVDRLLPEGRVVHAPAVVGGVLLSVRGGDFELSVGQDLSIGYAWHEKHDVELFLAESFTFRVLEPAAAVFLRYQGVADE